MDISKLFAKSSQTWLQGRTIFLTRHGSHAYGTNTPTSDEDFRGVAIPPREYYLGFNQKFEHFVTNDPDMQVYELRKFFKLAVENNPNVLEILFTDPSDHLIVTKLGQKLLDNREAFVSRAAKERFLGYARSQAHRIKNHRRWLLNPPKHCPTREEYGLAPELKPQLDAALAQISKKIDAWHVDFEPFSEAQKIWLQDKLGRCLAEMEMTSDAKWMAAARTLGHSENFILLLNKEKQYRSAKDDWDSFQRWKSERNPARAELEMKYGMDCKHMSHLVRLMRMAHEILSGKGVIVKRPDAEELLYIKNGGWTYEEAIAYTDNLEKEVAVLYPNSPIKPFADTKFLQSLCIEIVEESFSTDMHL